MALPLAVGAIETLGKLRRGLLAVVEPPLQACWRENGVYRFYAQVGLPEAVSMFL